MKTKMMLGALALWAAAQGAQAGNFRCHQPDGSIRVGPDPCPVPELSAPEASAAVVQTPRAAPQPPGAAPRPMAAPVTPPASVVERPVSVPAAAAVAPPAAAADRSDHAFVPPNKRQRDILDLTAQFERCRDDVPGFAEKSEAVYDAWAQRHAAVLAEYRPLLVAKVRAGRRGELTLPLQQCTDDWLEAVEPLTHAPDPRYASAEQTWQVVLGALLTGDRETALGCLVGSAQARWRARVVGLSDDDLRRMAASIRGMKVQWGDDYEKEGLVADTANAVMGIAFRNVNEDWKISELGGGTSAAQPAQ